MRTAYTRRFSMNLSAVNMLVRGLLRIYDLSWTCMEQRDHMYVLNWHAFKDRGQSEQIFQFWNRRHQEQYRSDVDGHSITSNWGYHSCYIIHATPYHKVSMLTFGISSVKSWVKIRNWMSVIMSHVELCVHRNNAYVIIGNSVTTEINHSQEFASSCTICKPCR